MQIFVDPSDAHHRRHPTEVVIAIARDTLGKHNPIAIGWSTIASGNPRMFLVAITSDKHSAHAIRQSRQFTVVYPSESMAADTMHFGTVSGADEDKLAVRGTATQPATHIDSVLLADAVANFECALASETIAGDHSLFVGRIVATHMNADPDVRRLYEVNHHDLRGVTAKSSE
jgi:flavin reductase (DIM6/NTAB) family NADH-FMN oxidoreductase RutF